jgi:hypothetical protein
MLLCAMQKACLVAAFMLMGLVRWAVAQDADRSVTGQVLKGEYSIARAMELVYGEYDSGNKLSLWTPARGTEFDKHWPDQLQVRVLADATYADDGVPRHVLVTWGKPEEVGAGEYSCHACGVLLGVSVFRKDAAGWKVEASNLQLAQIGAMGQPPQAKVQRLGPHAWGVVAHMGDMHQGQVEKAMWIYGPKAGGFHEWFKVELVDDDKYGEFPQDDWCKVRTAELDVMCVWREIDYALQPAEGKQVYDLVKTRRTPKGVKLEVWRFNGERFAKAAQQQSVAIQ